jgi:Methyltransferase domain
VDGIVGDDDVGEVVGAVVDGGVDVEEGMVDVGAGVGSCCARAVAVVVHTTTTMATNARVPVRAHRGQITASLPFARGPNRTQASKGITRQPHTERPMGSATKPLASAPMAVHDSVTGASASGTGQSEATEESGIFGSYYYAHDCGTPYERNEHWLAFFGEIAETVVRDLAPTTALDAGCAIGLFVEALRERGVDAYGVDVSEWAIDHLAPGARGFCTRASLADPLPRRYDLITCIEVLEHIPEPEASRALANLCAATDRLLLSTSPHDYAEATHVNVQSPDEWAARLAQHGFLRDLDFNATVITPWAALFTRRDEALSETVRRYERASFRLTEEVGELRRAALTRQRQLEEAFDGSELIEYRQRLQRVGEDLLTERDRLAAGEAQLGAALGRVATLEDELRRYELAVHDLERLRRSPFWGLLSRYLQLRTTIGRKIRRLLPHQG